MLFASAEFSWFTFVVTTLFSTFLSSVLSLLTAIFVTSYRNSFQELARIREDNKKLLELSIQYPHLENRKFCDSFDPESEDDKKLQYEIYCICVFNLISRVWEHAKKDAKKVQAILAVDEYVLMHQNWWKNDLLLNAKAYETDFITFINTRMESDKNEQESNSD